MDEYRYYDSNKANESYYQNNKSFDNINPYYSYYSEQKWNNYDDLKTSHFYSERYEKPNKGKMREMLVPLLIVAILSSVIGGAIVGTWFQFGAPSIAKNINENIETKNTEAQQVKQIEIINTVESPVTAIAEKVSPSIVGIKVDYTIYNYWFGSHQSSGSGSGIIIRSDGYILTNNHVIEAAIDSGNRLRDGSSIKVILPNQKDEYYEAIIIGRDEKSDIAVLKIDLTDLPAVDIGDSDALKVGELAVAIGNPGGLEFMGSVTSGIISGLNRRIQLSETQSLKVIQTDAAINPGNSGGALVNSKGEVIGVNTVKISSTGYEGLGFAIPINDAMHIAENLIENGYVRGRPSLGVYIDPRYTEDYAKSIKAPVGLLVYDVKPLSGAYNAGIKPGDVIVEINGIAVKSFSELEIEKNKHKAGDVVTLKIYRVTGSDASRGEYLTFDVTLSEEK
ncbi:MAG: trypsin-like serine protease [Clostridiaceae bacterium]|nr:trypsin-like serine protease [Clostridiaceae bacterium]